MKTQIRLLTPYRNLGKSVYIICFSRFINALGALIFPFLTLILKEKIHLSDDVIGLYIFFAGIVGIPASILGGYLSDKVGRKKVILLFEGAGLLLFAIMIFLETNMTLVYFLLVLSLTFRIAEPAHTSLLGDITTPENRQSAFALNYLTFNLGFAVAMSFAGYLFYKHLRLMFAIDFFTALIAVVLILFFVEDHYDPNNIHSLKKESKQEEIVSGSILEVLMDRKIILFFAVGILGYRFAYSQWQFLVPLHAAENFGEKLGANLYGNLGVLNALMVVFMTPLITSIFNKRENLEVVIVAGIFFMVGFGMLGFFDTKLWFYFAIFLMSIGEIMEAISTLPFVMIHTPASHRGRMSAIIPMIMGIGWTVGPLVMGRVSAKTSYPFSWRVIGVVVFVSIIILWMIQRREEGIQ